MAQVLHFFADPWNIVGLLGQLLFASRFIIQWLKSEIAKKSIITVAIWYCGSMGGIVTRAYAVYREEPVFILSQSMRLIVYFRNLYLIFRERKAITAD